MSTEPQITYKLLIRAREGDTSAFGQLCEQYRSHLRFLAEKQLDHRIAPRLTPSDIVQQTFLEANHSFANFRGHGLPEFTAWLRRILEHNIRDAARSNILARKRSVRVEHSIDDSATFQPKLKETLSAHDPTPSRNMSSAELAEHVQDAMTKLSVDQRQAVWLRHFEGLTLCEISKRLERSEVAVAGLLKRGTKRLKHLLRDE